MSRISFTFFVRYQVSERVIMDIKSFQYNNITEIDKQLLKSLLYLIWEDINIEDIHPQEMNVMSFCAIEKNEFIGYLGVVSWNIIVKNKTFKMCGLSCVCTHPEYREQGIGSMLVRKATEWLIQEGRFDIGLFTCSQRNTPFYEHIGWWQKCSNLVLKESDREGAYVSDSLQLNVFKLLISAKAKLYANYFENSIVTLNFPKGKFI